MRNEGDVYYSFIIPVYNCEHKLDSCVQSIIHASIESFEIILVNDGSTDRSGDICANLAENNTSVRYLSQSNGGASSARNTGLKEARGIWVLFADADDMFDSDELKALLCKLNQIIDCDLVIYGLYMDYYFKGKRYREDCFSTAEESIVDQNAFQKSFISLFKKNYLTPVWNKVFRTDIIRDNQLEFCTEMTTHEDMEFSIRYLTHCKKIYLSNKALYHYRIEEENANGSFRLKRIHHLSEVLNYIEDALKCYQIIQGETLDIISMLNEIYLYLARDKIKVSSIADIKGICADYSIWRGKHYLHDKKASEYESALLSQNIGWLISVSIKSKIRHACAVRLKARQLIHG